MAVSSVRESKFINSSISEISVAEVRKSLAFIRKNWEAAQTDDTVPPMYLVNEIGVRNLTIESFALKFVSGHHARRASVKPQKT